MRECLLFLIFIDTINCSIIINLNDNGVGAAFYCPWIECLLSHRTVFVQPIGCNKIVIILNLIIDYLLKGCDGSCAYLMSDASRISKWGLRRIIGKLEVSVAREGDNN